MDQFNQYIIEKFLELGISEGDFEEQFVRSSGPGGQNVNKVSTCVVLKYLPTGMVIKCQSERTQLLNRQKAREELIDRLETRRNQEKQKKIQAIEKKRRQNRKRSKAAKERMLEEKKKQAEKKVSRRKLKLE